MRVAPSIQRSIAVGLLASGALVAASGCRWFHKTDDVYKQSAEARPLEVPPDLNQPDTSSAMTVPGAQSQSVLRSSMASPSAAGSAVGFTVPGERDQVFAKVGEVLAATAGVTVVTRAQLLGTYDIDYEGSKFLVRITKVDAGTYVSAVDPRGLPATGEAPAKLMAALKAGMGG